ncbi:MAG: NADH-quinone oxidoreductase subunit F [Spirochaetaceae bacterium]
MRVTTYLTSFAQAKNPLSIEEYESVGGFEGLKAALGMAPGDVTTVVKEARLAGRGGAGFDTGTKWSTIPDEEEVYVVCNADEGEPGTFKDRFLLERAPFLVIEGLAIAAYAVGARKAFIYIRGEYPVARERVQSALDALKGAGFPASLGHNGDFQLEISVKVGGGSYVVGDETALLNSLMGNRGYPLLKPPFPTEQGLWEKPTVVNNVETLACVPLIMARGASWFAEIGSEKNPGPKLYSVSGHVAKPGVYELPMGATVGEVLEVAGGPVGTLKAVQIGGTAGPFYTPRALGLSLDFASMREAGGSLGSGAVVVINSSVSMIQVLQVTARFFSEESCGQCFACRYGTRQLEYMANEIAAGRGKLEYLRRIRETAEVMDHSSFCPFGQSVKLPIYTLLDNFGEEITTAIKEHEFLREVS